MGLTVHAKQPSAMSGPARPIFSLGCLGYPSRAAHSPSAAATAAAAGIARIHHRRRSPALYSPVFSTTWSRAGEEHVNVPRHNYISF